MNCSLSGIKHILTRSNMIQGRPKNGMFIAIPQEMKDNVQDISPNHWRLQAVVINTLGNKKFLIMYFPTDPKIQDFDYSDL